MEAMSANEQRLHRQGLEILWFVVLWPRKNRSRSPRTGKCQGNGAQVFGVFGIVAQEATQLVIKGNVVQNWAGVGIFVTDGSTAFESNTVINNQEGIVVFASSHGSVAADLGGGAMGSTGSNIISCNRLYDLLIGSNASVSATNNDWHDVPVTSSSSSGIPAAEVDIGYTTALPALNPVHLAHVTCQ
jgi:hypothetical protein